MAVTWAREVDPGVMSYCDIQDVKTVLLGVAADAEGDTLEGWMSRSDIDGFIRFYLEATRMDFEDMACRDFGYHEDVEVAVDGSGTEVLDLGFYGFWPLLELTSLYIDGSDCDVDDYTVTVDGKLSPADYWGGYPIFTRGHRNVELVLTYGYIAPPSDVRVAQAELVACRILPLITASNAGDLAGLGGYQRVQFGEVSITHYQQGRYAPFLRSLTEHAQAIARRYRMPSISTGRPMVMQTVDAVNISKFRDE